ncbi:HIT family protein [Rufibacter glacialis]|uniref:HIT family protein n=1 Tax=Rufibacter glacialis TaxID=1259555 RepID=A0A5M8Q9B4_9BACT|nr:HIT family protein [Rufibacter glacialis]KAA6431738.1 HIT family protein [Rufibacter glacialis]GGK82015.1 HIT family protein [Rufibacter glacialis]
METIFSKIIKGEIPAYKVLEDERFVAFLDAFPLVKGHTLVIPKEPVDYIFDLDPDTLGDLHKFAQKVAVGLKKVIPCQRISVAVAGLEVPHAHIHLIPMNQISDLSFSNPKLKLEAEEMEGIAGQIKQALKVGGST